MSMWSLAAAVALTGVTVGPHQDQAVGHVRAAQAPAIEASAQHRVSVSFSKASAREVLDWLSKSGGSFVIADNLVPKDVSLTMKIEDRPLNEVMDAVAEALGGHWEWRGGTRVFRKGAGFEGRGFALEGPRTWSGPNAPKVMRVPAPGLPNMKEFKVPSPKEFMPDMREFYVPDMKHFEEMEKLEGPELEKIREKLRALPRMKVEVRKHMDEAMRAHEKAMAESGQSMKISKKAMEEARAAMEKARKEHPRRLTAATSGSTPMKRAKSRCFERVGPLRVYCELAGKGTLPTCSRAFLNSRGT